MTYTKDGKTYRTEKEQSGCTGCAFLKSHPGGTCSCVKPLSFPDCIALGVIFREVKESSVTRDSKGRFCKSQKGIEKKYIKLGKPYIEDHCIKVVIEEQSHRGNEFGNEKCTIGTWAEGKTEGYKASNGLWLASRKCPGSHPDIPAVFMQGASDSEDNEPLEFDSLEAYLKFEDAVKEYNEHFKAPQVKEVTMEELHKLLGYEVKIKEGK